MTVDSTRTEVVKSLEEAFIAIVKAGGTPPTIVSARSVGQIIIATGATTLETHTDAYRGAGHTGTAKAYAVALTAVRSAAVITIAAKTFTFAAGDPPGTAVPNSDDSTIDITATPTIATATKGDMFAIVEQPPDYSADAAQIPYVTAKNEDPDPITRDIRYKGVLQHRKRMALQGGTLNLTALYENAKKGLSAFVDQDIIIIAEIEDDRSGTVTERRIYYGCRINSIPAPSEATGDTDSDCSIAARYELLAVVGSKYTA